MRASRFLFATLRETPNDAEVISHQLMLRAGMIRKLASGLYTWLPMGVRVLNKVAAIVHEEMNNAGSLEVLMPVTQPASLWEESGRYVQYGPELLRFKDRHGNPFVLGPTHEEVITDLARNELKSYKQLPANFYQVQTKFRDEIRPRFGVMRSREFIMKDAYSFHASQESLQETYDIMYGAYCKIFSRLGLDFRPVQADTGSIGGSGSHEFHVLASSGEDDIAFSTESDYTSDQRAATSALITNPFIQFAIKNPTSAATREVLGFRVSAEKIKGLMTLGTNNDVDANNNAIPNGINTFSGYMKTKTASGTAVTAARNMTYTDTGLTINGAVSGRLFGSSSGTTCVGGFLDPCHDISYSSDTYNLSLSSTSAPFTINSTVVSGTRMKDVTLKGTGTVGQIDFSGQLTAKVLGFLNLDKQVSGNITGLKTDITVNQSLGLIHALYLNNPASLSLQSQDILWTGAAVGANKGWWLAMEDEVELGSLSPTTKVAITNEVLKQTIAGINKDLTDNPRNCGNLLTGCVGGSALVVGNVPMNTTTLDFPLTNLSLQGQNFRSNCYGGLKFC